MEVTVVMQPYLFPYPGYFELVAAADHFIFYDDVQFVNRGWVNRNRLSQGAFTVPLDGAPQETAINERTIAVAPYHKFLKKWRRGFDQQYGKAEFYSQVSRLVDAVFLPEEHSIAAMAERSICLISEYLDLPTAFTRSSEVEYDRDLDTEPKMLSLLSGQGAELYLNLAGGRHLYTPEAFERQGIELRFLDTGIDFSPGERGFEYSILHLLAHYSPVLCRQWLSNYTMKTSSAYGPPESTTP